MTTDAELTPVIIESPYSGDVPLHIQYLRACMRDCLVVHGEAPYASHALYTQPGVLRDEVPLEREAGIRAGFAVAALFRTRVFYTDLGWSNGMRAGRDQAVRHNQIVMLRTLGDGWHERHLTDVRAGRAVHDWTESLRWRVTRRGKP